MSPPRATYRLQLHAGFTLDDATAAVPYLERLGISHVYSSPILAARRGSTHGYDVVDHGRVNPELGGEPAFERLTDALRARGMGLVIDIVPNHMAIGEENRWWWDVLAHGPASRYAGYFDVDWDPPESRLRNVILLPVLPDHYGRVLEAGELRVRRRGAELAVEHADDAFPLDPQTLAPILAAAARQIASDELGFVASALGDLPPSTWSDPKGVSRRQRDSEVLEARLAELVAQDRVAAAVDRAVAALNDDVERLDDLLERQNYRLALWRAAARDLGYRRFFDIDELVGLRTEDEKVFEDTHRLVLDWVRAGGVQGLRVDHPDGLRDPAGYFARLRDAAPDAWIVAEKILDPDERLPADWAIDGTTGYRFANLATGMLVEHRAEPAMSDLWAGMADAGPSWDEVALDARRDVLATVLGSDVNRLTDLFVAVCEANRRYRDFTRHELHHAVRELAAALPVYRTYVRATDRYVSERDSALVTDAARCAAARRPDLDPELFEFLARILRLEERGDLAGELAMRFQQMTPAAMAKGVEDTAFYRHHRLVALNEVGGDPGRFGASPHEFHAAMTEAQREWPAAMLALSTHDTKRSADVRARLAASTHDPDRWIAAMNELVAAAEPHRADATHPTDADLYLYLQTLVGAWPIDQDRASAYMAKATREAKLRTSWTDPDEAYDAALDRLVRGTLTDARFLDRLRATVEPLVDAGMRAAVVQLVTQLTAPGVPDVYQGTELWDLSLVDPDNRRPVDFAARDRLLDEATSLGARDAWAARDRGLAKLWLLARLLDLRARHPEAFGRASTYQPLEASGGAARIVAYARGASVVVVAPIGDAGSADAVLELPGGVWLSLDGARHAGRVAVADLVEPFPVAVLEAAAAAEPPAA